MALPAILFALGSEAIAIRLSYTAPESCPDRAELFEAVRARTDRVRLATGNEPRMDISVRVATGADGFSGEVRETVNGQESTARTVEGATCREVVEALSLTIALSIDPEAHAPRPQVPVPEPLPPEPCAPVSVPPKTTTPLQLELGLSGLGTLVDTAGLSAGAGLSLTVLDERPSGAGGALQLLLAFVSTGFGTAPSDHRTRFGAVSLEGCPLRARMGHLELAPCALGTVGLLEATGQGFAQTRTVTRAWWSGGLDLQSWWHLSERLVVDAAFGASVPFVKRRFFGDAAEHVIGETPAVSPLLRFGLGYRF